MREIVADSPHHHEPATPRRALGLVLRPVAFDLSGAVPFVLVWVFLLGTADPWVAGLLGLARLALMVGLLVGLTRPLEQWLTATRRYDDRELLRLDATTQFAANRIVIVHGLAWLVCNALTLVLAWLGTPTPLEIGPAELVVAGLLAIAMNIGALLTIQPTLREGLEPYERSLAAALAERGLARRRDRASIVNLMRMSMVGSSVSVLVGMMAISASIRITGLRDTALAELAAAAEHARADMILEGGTPRPPDAATTLELVEHEPLAQRHFDRTRARAHVAVALPDGRWLLATREVDEQIEWALWLLAGLVPFMIITSVMITKALLKVHVEALDELARVTREMLRSGDVRQANRIVPLREDEVGALIHVFNDMLDVLGELAETATTVADGNLDVRLERPGDLHDAFRRMLEHIRGLVVETRESAQRIAEAATLLHGVTREQERAAETQSSYVEAIGFTLAELAASAAGVATTAQHVRDDAERSLQTTDLVAARTSELSRVAIGIGELLDQIQDIAERSNLLALNGSLEATRAGEAGRGFAIVAAELRRLAERISKALEGARARVAEVRNASAGTVLVTDESRKLAKRSAEAAQQIWEVTDQQSQATGAVAEGAEEVTRAVVALATNTARTHAATEDLRRQVLRLEQLSGRFVLRDPD
jgi:methyl-accepting chemotaxis protein